MLKEVSACLGYQQITSLSSAAVLTVPVSPQTGNKPKMALIQAETQSVRWRDDGTAPTASVGMILTPNTVLQYDGDLNLIKFIEVTPTAKLNVSYYN